MASKKLITSLDKDIYSLVGSVGLLASNVAFGGFLPFGNLIPITLTSLSGGSLVNNIFNNDWEKIFKKNEICNGDGEFPKLLHEFKSETETKYIFKMPNKLTPYSLVKCQDVLESAMHKPMKISVTKNFYAEIIVFEKPSLHYFWYKIFQSCGITNKEGEYPNYLKSLETKIGLKHIFKLPFGLCVEMFDKLKPIIQSAMNKPVKLNVTPENELVIQEYLVYFAPFYKPLLKNLLKKKDKKISYIDLGDDKDFNNLDLVFPIGITLDENGEKLVYIDLIDEPNVLIAGINGSGKTSIAKILITLMILYDIEIKIMDLKFGGDYNIFKNYNNLTTFTKDVEVAGEEIEKIIGTMDKRYELLDNADCGNYREYNKKNKDNPIKPLVVFIDEYYMLQTKKKNKSGQKFNIVEYLNPILAKARACNIKFIISLQRPCKDNLDPVLKANLNHVIGLRTNNNYNSGIILGEGDSRLCTDLHGKGEAIISDMYQDIMFKSFFLEDDEIKRIIKHKCNKQIEKPKAVEPVINNTIPIELLKQNKEKVVDLIAK